jgi:hypothetical protein
MKVIALAAVLAVVSLTYAVSSAQDKQEKREEHAADSVLEARMHEVEDAVHALRRSLKDPAKAADSLAHIATLQAAAVAAKSESPRMLPHVPEGDRPKFLVEYRREMVRLLQASLALENAVLDGKQDAIDAAYQALRSMEDPAHERFTEEEK